MRPVSLTTAKGGINRQKVRAGARADSLYDLVNAYPSESGEVRPRPGTTLDATLPEGTVGLTGFRNLKWVYAKESVVVPAGYALEILRHPTLPELDISVIHFAEPFLGYLYVVAEFDNGDIFHYWLQPLSAWQANTVYLEGTLVSPTAANGYAYKATRIGDPNPLWQANVPRQIGDRVEPTVPNGYYYEVVEVFGANPSSGPNEPVWPAEDGATIDENVDGSPATAPPATTPPVTAPVVPPGVIDRYGPIFRAGINIDSRQTE